MKARTVKITIKHAAKNDPTYFHALFAHNNGNLGHGIIRNRLGKKEGKTNEMVRKMVEK